MRERDDEALLGALHEIGDGSRGIIALLTAQRAPAADRMGRGRERVEESIALQKVAPARRRTVTRVAIPGILACTAAIVSPVVRYF